MKKIMFWRGWVAVARVACVYQVWMPVWRSLPHVLALWIYVLIVTSVLQSINEFLDALA